MKFNNLGLALGMDLKLYNSVTKGLKLKLRKFSGLIPTFVEVTGEKLVGGLFAPPPILNRVKATYKYENQLQSIIHEGPLQYLLVLLGCCKYQESYHLK